MSLLASARAHKRQGEVWGVVEVFWANLSVVFVSLVGSHTKKMVLGMRVVAQGLLPYASLNDLYVQYASLLF